MSETKFFTNESENDLYSRFATILQDNTQFFDALVGYFRTSGFYRMYKAMESVEKIRILVGLNVDKKTVEFIDQAKNEILTEKQSKDEFANVVKREFEEEDMTKEKETGVRKFIEWLKSGKMEMRIYHEQPIHAKVYILRRKQPSAYPGSVITGSSNFSISGLQNNLEFNVELRDDVDIRFAIDKFEELWVKSVPITNEYVEAVEKKTWLREDITPYQIFLKTLYEFFEEEINGDLKVDEYTLLPDGFKEFRYQRDAVTQAKKILDAYNGVFISDVVGLGKTFICAKLAQRMHDGRILVVCPPVLTSYWGEVMREFNVAARVISLGKLDQLSRKEIAGYRYVFVDEAHRFRNSNTDNFTMLHEICYGKKVVLISATPLNNYSKDIANQLYLFQDKHDSTIVGVKDLEDFFAKLTAKENKFKRGTPEFMEQLRENSEFIRDRILRHVMVRRTRNEIMKYYADDIEAQGLKFPEVGNPIAIAYEFDEEIDKCFNETMHLIGMFTYSRYKPLTYLLNPNEEQRKSMVAQQNMAGFMRGILVKRLESSFYAFKHTVDRFVESYAKFIEMYKAGDVYISKKVDVYDLLDRDVDKLLEAVEEDRAVHFGAEEFNDQFIVDLERDYEDLVHLKNLWEVIDDDPKLDKFRNELLSNVQLFLNKKIIFTESRETAEYLGEQLRGVCDGRVVVYSGGSSLALKAEIEKSFNPAKYDADDDKFDVLITTDVLSEGVNLHKANVVINYDLPWNPTRIMQRVGRINRVGTEFEEIYVFNFFPTQQSSQHISLTQRIKEKLQMFHSVLGDDFKYLTEDEQVTGQKLFDALQAVPEDAVQDNPELGYLYLMRHIRDNNKDLFAAIKDLPKKARSARLVDKLEGNATLSFIRKGALKTFYMTDKGLTKRLEFLDAIKFLECEPEEKQQKLGDEYYSQFGYNSVAFDAELADNLGESLNKKTMHKNDQTIMKLLKIIRKEKTLTDSDIEKVDALYVAWKDGRIPDNISKEIVKAMKKYELIPLFYKILDMVGDIYLQERAKGRKRVDGKKQVILSCYLQGGK